MSGIGFKPMGRAGVTPALRVERRMGDDFQRYTDARDAATVLFMFGPLMMASGIFALVELPFLYVAAAGVCLTVAGGYYTDKARRLKPK